MKFLAFFYFICAALAVVPPLAPLSIQKDFPVGYFGAPPSSDIDPSMIGPVQLLNSTLDINLEEGTITLPLYHGRTVGDNSNIWYVVTDASDLATSITLGVHFTPKLAFVERSLLRTAIGSIEMDLALEFESGNVDFTPVRQVVPGVAPNFWPLDSSSLAGSQGNDQYTSLILIEGQRIVMNAPIIASSSASEEDLNTFCDGISSSDRSRADSLLHDRIVSICPRENRVTFQMTYAVSYSRPFWYLALDVSDQSLAALEGATYAPRMSEINTGCFEQSICPTEIAMTMVNGYTNADFTPSVSQSLNFTNHPLRQGLNSAANSEGPAIHVMGEIPTLGIHQSPLWDIFITEWSEIALEQNIRTRVRDIFEGFGYNIEGWLMNYPNGTELMSSSVVFNAPAVYRLY